MSGSEESGSGTGALRITGHALLGPMSERRTVRFTVDGRETQAFAGEPIAVAMMAYGTRVSRTMPESDAPRGYFCGVGRCTDCLMTVDGTLNVRTCVIPVVDGMVVETQQGLGEWKAGR